MSSPSEQQSNIDSGMDRDIIHPTEQISLGDDKTTDYIPLSSDRLDVHNKDANIVAEIMNHDMGTILADAQASDHLQIVVVRNEESLLLSSPFSVQGNIVDGDGNVVCRGLPISKELANLQDLSRQYNTGKYLVRPFYEGSLLRVFHYKGRWRIATSRKMDAFHSRWGSLTSFGELFQSFLDNQYRLSLTQFYETLNVNYAYYFLFTSESVYYVHPTTSSQLRLLFVVNDSGEEITENYSDAPLELMEYKDYQSAISEFVENKHLGLVLENDQERYTLFSAEYAERKRLYGNQKYLGIRLLELRGDPQDSALYQLHFPQSVEYFKRVALEIERFCRKVHRAYISRFVQRNYVEVDGPIHHFVKLVHKNYLENKKPTYLANVVELFLSQTPDVQFLYLKTYLPTVIGGKTEK